MPGVATPQQQNEVVVGEVKKPKRESGRPQPTFLSKTYEMINQADPAIGGWNEDGATFVVKEPKRFAHEIIPKYFKHSNFSSFVRQLNFYGFHKLKNDSSVRNESELGWWQFKHEFFVRGNASLLNHIKRKTYADPATLVDKSEVSDLRRDVIELKDQVADLLETVQLMKASLDTLEGERGALKDEVEKLRGALNKREHDPNPTPMGGAIGSLRKKQRIVKDEPGEPGGKEIPIDLRPSFDVPFTPSMFSPSALGFTDLDKIPASPEYNSSNVGPTPLAFDERAIGTIGPDNELSGFMGDLGFDMEDIVTVAPNGDDDPKSKNSRRSAVSWATAVEEMKEVVSQNTSPVSVSSSAASDTSPCFTKETPEENVSASATNPVKPGRSSCIPAETSSADLEACLSNIPQELQEKLAVRLVSHLLSTLTPSMLASATARVVSSCAPNPGLIPGPGRLDSNLPVAASVC